MSFGIWSDTFNTTSNTCMYVCMYVCMCMYIQTYMNSDTFDTSSNTWCVCVYKDTYQDTCMRTHRCLYTCMRTHRCLLAYGLTPLTLLPKPGVCVRVCVCARALACFVYGVCALVCMHVHTYRASMCIHVGQACTYM